MRSSLRAFLLPLLVLAVLVVATSGVAAQRAPTKPQAPTKPAVRPPAGDTSRTSLDWPGTYTGVLPCADCEGIETTITLSVDLTYAHENRQPHLAFSREGSRVTGFAGCNRITLTADSLVLNRGKAEPLARFVAINSPPM
jgi:hypothetical protein